MTNDKGRMNDEARRTKTSGGGGCLDFVIWISFGFRHLASVIPIRFRISDFGFHGKVHVHAGIPFLMVAHGSSRDTSTNAGGGAPDGARMASKTNRSRKGL